MPRLIDADALLRSTDKEAVHAWEIALAPTIDAVEVVQCKDCKFFDHSDFGKGEEYWCKHFVSTDDYTNCHKVMEDDFCAWGEREEES